MKSSSKTRKWLAGAGALGLALTMTCTAPWTAPVWADNDGGHGHGHGNHNAAIGDGDYPGDYLNSIPGEFLGPNGAGEDHGDHVQALTDAQRAALRQARLTRDAAILAALQAFLTSEQTILGAAGGAPLTDAQSADLLQARQTRDAAIAAAQRTFRLTVQQILGNHVPPGQSHVRLITATANATSSKLILTFNGGLNPTQAATASNYAVTVNGLPVTVSSATYDNLMREVTLSLPAGALHVGDRVTIASNGLQDASGNAVPVTTTLTVPTPPAPVAFTSASANVARNALYLFFNGFLSPTGAATASDYTVTVNGLPLTVSSALYTRALRLVTLTVPSGSLHTGDVVAIAWNGLQDLNGNAVTGQTTLTIPQPQTNVTLSSAVASVANSLVTLRFSGPLNATTASTASNYTLTVNGLPVTVESAGYTNVHNQVTLGLPVGALQAGDQVMVSWSGLQDIHGLAVTGHTTVTAH